MVDLTVFGFLPKRARDAVAISLRKAIMAWIDEHPDEFTSIYTTENPISYHAEKIFDIVMSTPDVNNRRDTLWPLAMSLILLCPDTIRLAVHAIIHDIRNRKEYNYSRISKKILFLDNVRQCARIDALAEISAVCMTDFAKAVYSFPRDPNNELQRYALGQEKEMTGLILDPASRIYKTNKDRHRLSQLVMDKLIAVYRYEPKDFNEIATRQAYMSSANTYITFNMARFCREYSRRTQVKLDMSCFEGVYRVVAPKMRRQLKESLELFVPTSPSSLERTPAKSTGGAAPVERSDLIVETLQNYLSNLECALIGTKLDDKLTAEEVKTVEDETAILDFIIEESVACKFVAIAEAGADLVELIYAPVNAWRWSKFAERNPNEGQVFWQYTYEP
jgi:hypothetical protein